MSAAQRWRLVQVAWLLVATFYVATFLLALPSTLRQQVSIPSWPAWTEPEARHALAELGWSVDSVQRFLSLAGLALTPAYMLLGGFIFWRRRSDPVALMLSMMFVGFLTTTQFDSLAQQWPGWLHIKDISEGFTTALFSIVFLVFPDGRFVPRWTRWAALALVMTQVMRVFQPDTWARVGFAVSVPMIVTLMLAQLYRYVRVSGPVQRQQTKWVVFGLTAGIVPLASFFLVLGLVPDLNRPTATGMAMLILGSLLWEVVLILLPLSLTIAILRSRLFDIDVIIRRTLIYAVLTGLLALAYFGSIVVLQNVFSVLTGQNQSTLVTVLSTLAIAALFVPLRARVQAVIDRRLYRRKYDAAQTLAAFGATMRDEVDLGALRERLLSVVDDALQPASVSLWVRPTERRQL